MERPLDAIVEVLSNARRTGRNCSLLIGAGCSVTAGIPAAGGFVELIKDRFPAAYGMAAERSYPRCMAQLARGLQRDLSAEKVDDAKINWANVAIAQMMKEGYVDRILTTNFDPLIMRACALLGEFPAVYDFAISQLFKPAEVPDKAVFHLHGQRTGFVLMNTEQDVSQHSERLGPIFEDAGRGRVWIVVGYSGENDPVFEHLARVPNFSYGLYWVGYRDAEPAQHVRERLLVGAKDAYYVRGYDADRFFVELTRKLGCFPPEFVRRPFSHLNSSLSSLTDFRLPGSEDKEIDVLEEARKLVTGAIERFEQAPNIEASLQNSSIEALELAATSLLMAGKYDELIQIRNKLGNDLSERLKDAIAWAYISRGNAAAEKADKVSSMEAEKLFAQAGEEYAAALALKPDYHETLNNWGVALAAWAKFKGGAEAERLLREAAEKYAAALALKPDYHEALNNWGNALAAWAKLKGGVEAERLLREAAEKYAAALALKPDMHEALNNWGAALTAWAKLKGGAEAERLLREAEEKYRSALTLGSADVPYNLACLYALRGDSASVRQWLEANYQNRALPTREFIENDEDFAKVRDEAWFSEFLDEVFGSPEQHAAK